MSNRVRVLTYNVLSIGNAEGAGRHEIARRGLAELRPDVVALQEVTRRADLDQAAELLGPEFEIVDLPGAPPDGAGECLASRLDVIDVATLDLPIDEEGRLPRASAAAIEVLGPAPVGALLVVHHKAAYQLQFEHVREVQALTMARFVEDLVSDRTELPVVLLGDMNAAPDAASIRFLTGRQSLGGMSVRYEDAWEAMHPLERGDTFTPVNPLVGAGEMPLERGRRIDYVMVRSGSHGPSLDVADCRLAFASPVDGVWASDHFGVVAELRLPA